MPGETFSYNRIVGKRTVAAGYKEASIYQNGQVVDGLGGGICQISSTLYNAAVAADMEIMQRRNHQFVPSYVNAGYDATVVWGSTDFQFLNILPGVGCHKGRQLNHYNNSWIKERQRTNMFD